MPPGIGFYKERGHRTTRKRFLMASCGLFPLWGCAFENARCVAARRPCPAPQERTGRRGLENGKALEVSLLPMAVPPPQPFVKFEIYTLAVQGQEPQQVLSDFVSRSKFPMNSGKKRWKSNIPMSPGSVPGFRGGILSGGIPEIC